MSMLSSVHKVTKILVNTCSLDVIHVMSGDYTTLARDIKSSATYMYVPTYYTIVWSRICIDQL